MLFELGDCNVPSFHLGTQRCIGEWTKQAINFFDLKQISGWMWNSVNRKEKMNTDWKSSFVYSFTLWQGQSVFFSWPFFFSSFPLQFLSFHTIPTSLQCLFLFCLFLVLTFDYSPYSLHLLYVSLISYTGESPSSLLIQDFPTDNIIHFWAFLGYSLCINNISMFLGLQMLITSKMFFCGSQIFLFEALWWQNNSWSRWRYLHDWEIFQLIHEYINL